MMNLESRDVIEHVPKLPTGKLKEVLLDLALTILFENELLSN